MLWVACDLEHADCISDVKNEYDKNKELDK